MNEAALRELTLSVVDQVGLDAPEVDFRSALWDAGLARVQFPVGKGGLELSPSMQGAVEKAIRDAGRSFAALSINTIGIGMGLPTVLTYGSDEHHDKHLKKIFTGEDFWCQMFSEPSHGSDVAGLSSRAVRDGDEWIVNGQKVWTSGAHHARFGMLLVRTDPDVPKHKGLSYFILDMHSPGVEIRPLFQITGNAEFNEVFFTDVRVPHSNLLGAVGDGWRVATTTLMNERVALGGSTAPRGSGNISMLMKLWEKRAPELDVTERRVMSDRVMKLWIEAEVGRLTTIRGRSNSVMGNPGPEGSVGKLASAELNIRIWNCCMDLLGDEGMLHEPGYPMNRDSNRADWSYSKFFLRSQANTIEGGTSDIMRNILGERVLGLPGEPRVDKAIPWTDIPA
ncbi:MAG: acyl-CoA dehydrogenase family protein [Acidimicrobiaceae bacterium]|jgi:alkylation response protein AidB-like acyl-CoA dehydrogenase|nr:acyl-CoA dehydrogenase family protein [Acidimicrobiaceae bacterium]MDB4103052.1 acyl-CoA dehydrogenase family protein [Acidimicrobiales bacterium]HAY67409.1 acyl-CoA dehydrogenase [Acidimicrobiaceae bacterium]